MLMLGLLLGIGSAFAQATFTWTGASNNNWNTAANWNKIGTSTSTWPGQNAGQNDQAIINIGTPILNAGIANTSLTSVVLDAPATLSLTAANTINITGPFSGTGTFIQSNGTLNATGNVTVSTFTITGGTFGYTGTGAQLVKAATYNNFTKSGGGTADLTGNVVVNGSTTLSSGILNMLAFSLTTTNMSGAGTLNFGGGLVTILDDNTHTGANNGSPVNYAYLGNVVATQIVRGITYQDLTFSGSAIKDVSAALTVSGTFTTASNIDQNGQAFVFQGPVVHTAGSITAGGNAITYNSASNQDVIPNSSTFTSFTKSGSGTASLSGNVLAQGTTLNAGVLDLGGFNFTATTLAGAGTLNGGSGTLTLTGSNTHSGTFNPGTSTVVYNVNAAQTIQGYFATGYYNLTISNNNTKTIANALKVNNIFLSNGGGTINFGANNASFNHFNQTNATINLGTGSVEFAGNINKTGGTLNPSTGPLALSGTGFIKANAALTLTNATATVTGTRTNQSSSNLVFGTLNITGTYVNKVTTVVNTALSGAGTFENDSIGALNYAGSGVPSVTTFLVSAPGTIVRYTAAGNQSTRGVAYFDLALQGGGTKTIAAGTTIGNNLAVTVTTVTSESLTIPGDVTGANSFTVNSPASLAVQGNYLNTGSLAISGPLTVDGNLNHGGGGLTLNASAVTIGGTLNGTGTISFSGAGSLQFTGPGGWTSTTGTFNPSTSTVTYAGIAGAQTVRSTTYNNLSLSGAATKNFGAGNSGSVAGVFSNPSGQTLVFSTSASTLALIGSITGTGLILGDPAGTLTVGSAGAVTTSLGTLYFDTTKAMGTINFNRQWNRAIQVRIGSSVRLNNYTFLGGFVVGGVEVADGEVFKVESPVVSPTSTLATNVGRLRYIMLGNGSKFVFEPAGTINAGTVLTFPVGPMPTASPAYDMLEGLGNGTLNAATIGATTINGTSTNFDDQILVGYNLYLEDGSLVGVISAFVSATQITLQAPGALVNVPAGSKFKLIQAYRPVTIIPSANVTGGSIEVSIRNHSGGGITSGTNVPNVPSNRRTNFIYNVRTTGGFPNYAIWTEALLSNDFNATIDDSKYSFFRWSGSFWIKLAADLVGPGGVPSNTQIRRNTVAGVAGVQTYILGQTGGVLPDDPTFSWTGGGGNSNWKQAGNWNVFPSGAGNWPDDIGHNVIIDGAGLGNPIIQSGDSINVRHISHSGKKLTIQSGGILNIVGNYSFNQPTLTAAGVGRLIQNQFSIVGTNGSQFTTQLTPGALLYTTEGGFIGAVRSITNNAQLTLQAIGNVGAVINIPDSSTYNIIYPVNLPGGGNLTASTGTNVVTGTGFSSAMNGRMLYVGVNLIGTIAHVQSATSLLLVNNSYRNETNQPYLISAPIVPNGSATTDFQTGSKVNYNNSNADQTMAATTYWDLNMMDNRVSGTTDITRYVNCPGRTITIRGQYRGRIHVKPAASLGPVWQFQNQSTFQVIFPLNANGGTGGIFDNFSTNGVSGVYNVKWGTLPTDRINWIGRYEENSQYNFPAMDQTIGNRFGNLTMVNTQTNGRWRLVPGANITVNGTISLTNTFGPNTAVLTLGNNTVNPAVSLTLLGPIQGAQRIQNGGTPTHQANLTIGGTGAITGDIFGLITQLRNLTLNRPGATLSLTAAKNLTITEFITLNNGTLEHTGSGTITSGSAVPSGLALNGGTLSMAGTSNLSLTNLGEVTMTNGNLNLTTTGSVTVAGNYTQSFGTINRVGLPITLQGNVAITGGTVNLTGSTVSLTGTNNQNLSGSASGFSFDNLTVNKTGGSVTVTAGKVKVTGTVSLPVTNTANLATTPGGNLTLVSNATGTARVAAIAGGTLTGSNFTMERYVNGGVQGWYFMGTPVAGQSLGDWGDDFDITTPLVCAGTNTDLIARNTVYRVEETAVPANGPTPYEANGWRAPASCSVQPGAGFRVFLNGKFFQYNAGKFENTGAMTVGGLSLPVTHTPAGYQGGGWNLVANPYPSNINWDAGAGWTKTNMQNAIYIWKGASNQYGSYVGGVSTNGVDNIIPSGQAFFVRANASPSLSINENAKSALAKNMMRVATNLPLLRLRAIQGEVSDETVVHFGMGATDAFDSDWDAGKMPNPALNISTRSGAESHSIQGLAPVEQQKTVPLDFSGVSSGNVQVTVSGISSLEGLDVFLKDNFLNTIEALTEGMVLDLPFSSDAAASGDGRFELIFQNTETISGVPVSRKSDFLVYPNPSSDGRIHIELSGPVSEIKVTDALGRLVWSKSGKLESAFDIQLPRKPGVYTLQADGKTRKVVIK
jgi:hypothetical protein